MQGPSLIMHVSRGKAILANAEDGLKQFEYIILNGQVAERWAQNEIFDIAKVLPTMDSQIR